MQSLVNAFAVASDGVVVCSNSYAVSKVVCWRLVFPFGFSNQSV
jgi:hypothetical protein